MSLVASVQSQRTSMYSPPRPAPSKRKRKKEKETRRKRTVLLFMRARCIRESENFLNSDRGHRFDEGFGGGGHLRRDLAPLPILSIEQQKFHKRRLFTKEGRGEEKTAAAR